MSHIQSFWPRFLSAPDSSYVVSKQPPSQLPLYHKCSYTSSKIEPHTLRSHLRLQVKHFWWRWVKHHFLEMVFYTLNVVKKCLLLDSKCNLHPWWNLWRSIGLLDCRRKSFLKMANLSLWLGHLYTFTSSNLDLKWIRPFLPSTSHLCTRLWFGIHHVIKEIFWSLHQSPHFCLYFPKSTFL